MKKFNTNVVLCKAYDEDTQSVLGIINQIELDSQMRKNPVTINIVTFLSGYGDEVESNFSLDYYINCVLDRSKEDGEDFSKKISYIFSMIMEETSESKDENFSDPVSHLNTFQNIGQIEKKVFLPCLGRFEVQVFKNTEKEEKNPLERYKKYREKSEEPISIYYFDVVDSSNGSNVK